MPTFLDIETRIQTVISQDTIVYLVRHIELDLFNIRAASPEILSRLKLDPDTRATRYWQINTPLPDETSPSFDVIFPQGELRTNPFTRNEVEQYFPGILAGEPISFVLIEQDVDVLHGMQIPAVREYLEDWEAWFNLGIRRFFTFVVAWLRSIVNPVLDDHSRMNTPFILERLGRGLQIQFQTPDMHVTETIDSLNSGNPVPQRIVVAQSLKSGLMRLLLGDQENRIVIRELLGQQMTENRMINLILAHENPLHRMKTLLNYSAALRYLLTHQQVQLERLLSLDSCDFDMVMTNLHSPGGERVVEALHQRVSMTH